MWIIICSGKAKKSFLMHTMFTWPSNEGLLSFEMMFQIISGSIKAWNGQREKCIVTHWQACNGLWGKFNSIELTLTHTSIMTIWVCRLNVCIWWWMAQPQWVWCMEKKWSLEPCAVDIFLTLQYVIYLACTLDWSDHQLSKLLSLSKDFWCLMKDFATIPSSANINLLRDSRLCCKIFLWLCTLI